MPPIDIVVAIWNRDTHTKQMESNPTRLLGLSAALRACEMQFARILGTQQRIKGIFVAPEYYFAADKAGKVLMDGSFNERCVSETMKDHIVSKLLGQSKLYPSVLMIPGTIAWAKPLQRRPGDEFKRDLATNQRTTVLKTQTRTESLKRSLEGSLNTNGAGGGRLATELLRTKVRKQLQGGDPMRVVSAYDVSVAVSNVVNDDVALTAQFGSPDGLFREVPTQYDAWANVQSGTAQHIMRNTAFVLLNGKICFKYNKANDYHEALSDSGRLIFSPGHKTGFTTIQGIDIGLEICLDHAYGRLVNTPLPLSGAPHLHILTSASVQPAKVIVRTGGYFIHASSNDGWAAVSKRTNAGWADAELLEEKLIDGDPMRLYKIQLAVP
jgi:hypothetical protein